MNKDPKPILDAIAEAQEQVSRNGGDIIIMCSGNVRHACNWIETRTRYNEAPVITLFSEKYGNTTLTRVDIQEVVSVGVESVSWMPAGCDGRVPPSLRDAVLMAILIENWSRASSIFSLDDLRDALKKIDDEPSKYDRFELEGHTPAEQLPSVLADLERIAIRIAQHGIPDAIMKKPFCFMSGDERQSIRQVIPDNIPDNASILDMIDSTQDTVQPLLQNDTPDKRSQTSGISDLPRIIQNKAAAALRLHIARREGLRLFHPFIARGEWSNMMIGF